MATSSAAQLMQMKAAEIVKDAKVTLNRLAELERLLNQGFSDMQEAVSALILSLLTGEPLLFVGPPGTGKSMLIHTLCYYLDLYDLKDPGVRHPGFFEYLLTPFTEPTELFGHYDIRGIVNNEPLRRLENDMMREAKVVYLDEVFNGSSAILNSILAFMNEKVVHDRGERKPAEWELFFASTNHRPEAPELQAVYDRFVLRCWVENVDVVGTSAAHTGVDNLRRLVTVGWNQTYGSPGAKGAYKDLMASDSLPLLRKRIKEITRAGAKNLEPAFLAPGYFETLATVVENARSYDLSQMSNRRIIRMTYVLLAHRLYQAHRKGESNLLIQPKDLELVSQYFLDNNPDDLDVQTLRRLVLARSEVK